MSAVAEVWLAPGPEQAAKEAESRRHSKVEPVSEEENSKLGVGSLMVEPSAGPEVIDVSGGVSSGAWVSTVKLRVAGVGSRLPA